MKNKNLLLQILIIVPFLISSCKKESKVLPDNANETSKSCKLITQSVTDLDTTVKANYYYNNAGKINEVEFFKNLIPKGKSLLTYTSDTVFYNQQDENGNMSERFKIVLNQKGLAKTVILDNDEQISYEYDINNRMIKRSSSFTDDHGTVFTFTNEYEMMNGNLVKEKVINLRNGAIVHTETIIYTNDPSQTLNLDIPNNNEGDDDGLIGLDLFGKGNINPIIKKENEVTGEVLIYQNEFQNGKLISRIITTQKTNETIKEEFEYSCEETK